MERLSPEEFWATYNSTEQLIRKSARDVQCYGLADWTGAIAVSEWDLGSRPPVFAGLAHGSPPDLPFLIVGTTSEDPRGAVHLRRASADGGLPPAQSVLRRLSAERGLPLELPVDGAAVSFTRWGNDNRWWAAASSGGRGLLLERRGLSPESVALLRVTDLEPYLAGSRRWMVQVRGGY